MSMIEKRDDDDPGQTPVAQLKSGQRPVASPSGGRYWITNAVEGTRPLLDRILDRFNFWTFVGTITALSFVYFFIIAERQYVSEAVLSLKNKTAPSGISSILSGLTSATAGNDEDAMLAAYIQSPEMLSKLDKKFHLRDRYASSRDPFLRLWSYGSDESFLGVYRGKIDVSLRHDVGLITLNVTDVDPKTAQAIGRAVVQESETFMNNVSLEIQNSSLKFARGELAAAILTVQQAKPDERGYAELRLQAAQQALATASGAASNQAVYVVEISNPTLPTVSTVPMRWLNTAAAALIAAILYALGNLLWSNVIDHRRV